MSHFNLKEAAISPVSRLHLHEGKQSFSVKSVHRNKMALLDSCFIAYIDNVCFIFFYYKFSIFQRLCLLSSVASTLDVRCHK